jgi:hypothetical protein
LSGDASRREGGLPVPMDEVVYAVLSLSGDDSYEEIAFAVFCKVW